MSERLPAIHLHRQSQFQGPQEHISGAGGVILPHLHQRYAFQVTQWHIGKKGELPEDGTAAKSATRSLQIVKWEIIYF